MQTSDVKTNDFEKSDWDSLDGIDGDKNKVQSVEYSSVCDIWKDNVHKLVTKMEYQAPIYLEAYSQVHTEFLHCIDNLFGTCYIWQKQYFDRLGIDQKIINSYGKLWEVGINNIIEFMDVYANYKRYQAGTIIDAMKIGNNYLHGWIDAYGNVMSFWNSQFNR